MRLTGEYEGVRPRGTAIRISFISGAAKGFDAELDPELALAVLDMCRSDPRAAAVIETLGHLEDSWTWVDLWRIWDRLRAYYSKDREDGHKRESFDGWAKRQDNEDKYQRFRRSANDPEFSDITARHGAYQPKKDQLELTPMGRHEARDYIRWLVIAWLEELTGKLLAREAFD